MFVTALVDLPPFSIGAAQRLGQAAGLPLRPAGERLQVPGHGPAVIGRFGDRDAAEAQLAALQAAGFQGFVLGPPWPPALRARQIVVLGDDLVVTTEAGERSVVPGARARAVIWGTRVLPPGSIVHDQLGPDGQVRPRRTPTEHREGLLRIFTDAGPVLCLGATALRGLDERAFGLLVRAVRRACDAAAFDDRLLARRTQEQILGPDLPPEAHLELAVLLLARAMEPRA
ncbi:MAG: hypothetical protein H6706_03550 [Myxococcales bacterium]|nr:hypothetical protein [Myxococcales bacterium]